MIAFLGEMLSSVGLINNQHAMKMNKIIKKINISINFCTKEIILHNSIAYIKQGAAL